MEIERQFEDLGVDAVVGVQLMSLLNVNPEDFVDHSRFMRFKDVIDYFKDVPHKNYLINQINIGKTVDKLDHTWGYVELAKQKQNVKSQIEGNMFKLNTLESLGDSMQDGIKKELKEKVGELNGEMKRINNQIGQYEA